MPTLRKHNRLLPTLEAAIGDAFFKLSIPRTRTHNQEEKGYEVHMRSQAARDSGAFLCFVGTFRPNPSTTYVAVF